MDSATTDTASKSDTTTKHAGKSYSVCEIQNVDGKKKFIHRGIAFIRENGRGGVLYFRINGPAGEEQEFALFIRLKPA